MSQPVCAVCGRDRRLIDGLCQRCWQEEPDYKDEDEVTNETK